MSKKKQVLLNSYIEYFENLFSFIFSKTDIFVVFISFIILDVTVSNLVRDNWVLNVKANIIIVLVYTPVVMYLLKKNKYDKYIEDKKRINQYI